MGIIFRHNNKLYQTTNLSKKLKRLKISDLEIEVIKEIDDTELEKEFVKLTNEQKEEPTEGWHNPRLYYYLNPNTGYSITSIYPDLNVDGYERTTQEVLERLWNKTG